MQTAKDPFPCPALLISLIETKKQFESLAGEWNELLSDSEADTIFLTWEWLSSWLATVFSHSKLFVVTVRDSSGLLLAVVPFYHSRLKFFGCLTIRCLRIIGDICSGGEYPDIIVRHGSEQMVIPLVAQFLADKAKAWECVWIPNISGWDGAEQRISQTLRLAAPIYRRRPTSFSARPIPCNWDEFWNKLSTNQRSALKRQKQKIERNHEVKSERCADEQSLPKSLENLFSLHNKRWESIGQNGSFVRRPKMANFYNDFAPKALKNGWLTLFTLFLDGDPVASQYGYVYHNKFFQLQEGYDPSIQPGVGNMLRMEIFRWCIDEGLTEYDFLGEHTDAKARWGSQARLGWQVFAGQRSIINYFIAKIGFWPTGRFLRQPSP